MRVLVDVSHPAHVHLFRNAIEELSADGHQVRVTSREKEVTTDLLDAFEIEHEPLSAKGDSPLSLAREWTLRELRLARRARQFDPDVVLSRLNPAAAHAARLSDARSVVFHDTEVAGPVARLTLPFADVVCTPDGFEDVGAGQVRYAGYQELAYLHPARFEPDPGTLVEHGVDPDEPYFLMRFVSGDAHHDVGNDGLSHEVRRELLSMLSDRGTVYVSSEGPAADEFEAHAAPVPPEAMHDLMAHATLYVGDSHTMATEAGILGTPAVRLNTFGGDDLSNFRELEDEYGLVRSTSDESAVPRLVSALLDSSRLEETWRRRRNRLLADKVDVTAFMLDRVELEARR